MAKIEKNIPVKTRILGKGGYVTRMEVGDSIFVDDYDFRGSVTASMRYLKMKPMVRAEAGGYRIWRIA